MYNKVKCMCDENGITITALEREIGLGRRTIAKWQKSSPTVENLKKVADYFGVSIEYFLEESERDAS